MTESLVLDAVLVLVLIWYALLGWRQGFAASVLSLVGFLAGGAVAMWALPFALERLPLTTADPRRPMLVVAVVLVAAIIGQAIGLRIGHGLRRRVPHGPVRVTDALFGAVATAAAASLLIWFLAGAVRGAGVPVVSRAISSSQVIQSIDRVVPPQTVNAFGQVTRALEAQGFPRVFEGVQAEPITPVEAPSSGLGTSAVMRDAARSVVRVDGVAPSCRQSFEGTGWVFAPRRVMTNAHVVAGTSRLTVSVAGEGPSLDARVVLFDPDRDVAVLDVPELTAPALPLGADLDAGADAAAVGYPLGGDYTVSPARVRAQLRAKGADIYGRIGPVREVYSLRTVVRPGNSGGPLLDTSGRVVGLIFATSLDDRSTGYALTLDEVRDDLSRGTSLSESVGTGGCATG